jgi:hypothetical protein
LHVEHEHWALAGLVDDINKAIDEAMAAARLAHQHLGIATQKALLIGDRLISMKTATKHGEFAKVVLARTSIGSMRTAQAYMRLASAYPPEMRNSVADLPLRNVLKMIAASKEPPPATPATPIRRATTSPIRNRIESDRVLGVFTAATKALRSARDFAQPGYPINGKVRDRIAQMRSRLQAAIDEIDRLGQQESV